ncbi:hypothetical protein [Amylibacter marinus]|nr:hypothetical protein [Amylibacter marinus]
MGDIEQLNIYVPNPDSSEFARAVAAVFAASGTQVDIRSDSKQAWKKSAREAAHCVFESRRANHPRAIQAIPLLGGHWAFEAAPDPSDWDIAQAVFNPHDIGESAAEQSFAVAQQAYIERFEFPYAFDDFVLILLDGDLGKALPHRPMSSFNLIKQVLKNEPERQVLIRMIGQAPNANQQARLDGFDLEDRISFTTAGLDRLLQACCYVVCQDTPLSLRAALHEKPVLHMGECGLHHIARNPEIDGRIQKSFNRMHRDRPDYARYIHWVLEHGLDINAPDFGATLQRRLGDLGW